MEETKKIPQDCFSFISFTIFNFLHLWVIDEQDRLSWNVQMYVRKALYNVTNVVLE